MTNLEVIENIAVLDSIRFIMLPSERRKEMCDALKMAMQALREQAERKGCEVCNGSLPCDNGCDGFCDICDVPEVWKTIHKTGQYNYCPMCGRKLKEDKPCT